MLGLEPGVGWLQKFRALASFPELPVPKPLGVVCPSCGLSGTEATAGFFGFSGVGKAKPCLPNFQVYSRHLTLVGVQTLNQEIWVWGLRC